MSLESVEVVTRILAELSVLVALFVGWGTWRGRA
jgi:hypothetical protein